MLVRSLRACLRMMRSLSHQLSYVFLAILSYFTSSADTKVACGYRYNAVAKRSRANIVGGTTVARGTYPWHAFVLKNGREHCGGSVIDRNWILTAAHCLDRRATLTVMVGSHERRNRDRKGKVYRVLQQVSHPQYSAYSNHDADIGLLKVYPALTYSSGDADGRGAIAPICLPDEGQTFSTQVARIYGSGLTSEGGSAPGILLHTKVNILNPAFCTRVYGQLFDAETMICAGLREGGRDSCQGDSGGTLEVEDPPRAYQIGVVSGGSGCARRGYPGIYTKVSFYRPWIYKVTGV